MCVAYLTILRQSQKAILPSFLRNYFNSPTWTVPFWKSISVLRGRCGGSGNPLKALVLPGSFNNSISLINQYNHSFNIIRVTTSTKTLHTTEVQVNKSIFILGKLTHLSVHIYQATVTDELHALSVNICLLLLKVIEDSRKWFVWTDISHHLQTDLFSRVYASNYQKHLI